MRIWILTIIVWIMLVAPSGADGGFTQVDRERMIRLEVKFEEIDKRFEQVDKRFEQIMSMFYILSGIFTAMFTAVFGFAWWDRRSILVQAREEARNTLTPHENRSQGVEAKLNNITELLRRWSAKKPELKELMRYCNLL